MSKRLKELGIMMMNSRDDRHFDEARGLDRVADEYWTNAGVKRDGGFIAVVVIAVIALLAIF